ncbi:MAG: NlpC/P60 family protein [Dehalococcoidales bacterium]
MTGHVWTRTEIKELIEEARTWIDVRFRHQGRTRGGVDCVGILGNCANARGMTFELPTDYTMQVDPKRLIAYLRQRLTEIPVSRMVPGDILLIRYAGRSTHLALRTDKGILHASTEFKKVVEHSYEEKWRRRTIAAFRLPGRRVDE